MQDAVMYRALTFHFSLFSQKSFRHDPLFTNFWAFPVQNRPDIHDFLDVAITFVLVFDIAMQTPARFAAIMASSHSAMLTSAPFCLTCVSLMLSDLFVRHLTR